MVRPQKRRQANPQTVQVFGEAIQYIKQQKQIPNLDRICKYMQRETEMRVSEVDLQLQYAVKDGLIVSYQTVGSKGSKVGVEQEGFKQPDVDGEPEKDGHDWYCFECHKPGEVLCCSSCWRVYHSRCTKEEYSGAKFNCSYCLSWKKKKIMKRKEINRLLGYTVKRLKDKTRELHRLGSKEEEGKLRWFTYQVMDLNTMEVRTGSREYRHLEEFRADAQVVFHNIAIWYGEYSEMADLAQVMLKDCDYDLSEIRMCKDCYNYSNAKPKDWFAQPCDPAHELVYAKQKGFTYWPAKVIKSTPQGCDVRFFGGWHQRAVIPRNNIKPIDTNQKGLTIKRTAGFVKACQELTRHQDFLQAQEKHFSGDVDDGSEAEDEEPITPKPKRAKKSEKTEKKSEKKEKKSEKKEKKPEKGRRKSEKIEKTEPVVEEPPAEEEEEEEEEREIEAEEEEEEVEEETKDTSMEVISSSDIADKQAPTPEDSNIVTSSEDKIGSSPSKRHGINQMVQTIRKRLMARGIQTDEAGIMKCNCEIKYQKIFEDYKEGLEAEHKEDKDGALEELSERLQKDFEEDKSQAVARAIANMQREIEKAKKQTEEKCKAEYMEEMKKLAQKHKENISTTKKKQWCFNCEEEAMYHCCWNTSYCSIKCQQEHWHKEHKRVCRRKR